VQLFDEEHGRRWVVVSKVGLGVVAGMAEWELRFMAAE
jgi:hypothetical protein